MALFEFARVPEPEVMEDSAEVQAYASAAAQSFLDAIDDTFVEHAVQLVKNRERGRAIDIGTGPGQIVIKLANRLTRWKFVGVDLSSRMISEAEKNLSEVRGTLAGRVEFQMTDGSSTPFPENSFDLVMCNSVLHHMPAPAKLLAEIDRLAKPGAGILLRDLRRPNALMYPLHVRWHGRKYSGEMLRLYRDSVRAAYTAPELHKLLRAVPLRGARVFEHRSTHIGIERPAAESP
jgi:ubiquinone/menaquinone biosynthesis C-methylase UbiE